MLSAVPLSYMFFSETVPFLQHGSLKIEDLYSFSFFIAIDFSPPTTPYHLIGLQSRLCDKIK